MPSNHPNVTQILGAVSQGDQAAMNELMPLVYDELRALANRFMRRENAGHTLQATALVHEAYMKLVDRRDIEWRDRAHFFAVAAQAIRRILVDHARTKKRIKRGGGAQKFSLDPSDAIAETDIDFIALDEALQELAKLSPRQAKIVELRFFGGLTMPEIAEVTDVSLRTVEGDWSMARVWLMRQLDEGA